MKTNYIQWSLKSGHTITIPCDEIAGDRAIFYADKADTESQREWDRIYWRVYEYAINDLYELADWVRNNPEEYINLESPKSRECLEFGKLEMVEI